MKKNIIYTALIWILLFSSQLVFAQGIHNFNSFEKKVNKQVKSAIERYNKLDHESQRALLHYDTKVGVRSSGDETQISGITSSESEVHAIINPNDSSNIIVSPMRQDAQGLKMPVYYTKDFGESWHKSSFEASSGISGTLVAGGGDPNFAFDANGKLYLSWINLYLNYPKMDSIYWAMFWAYSMDGGATWHRENNDFVAYSSGAFDMSGGGLGLDYIYDKEWMACDHSNGQYKNNLYMAMVEGDMSVSKMRMIVRKKPASSTTFENKSIYITDSEFLMVQFAGIAVDNNGDVHVSFYGTKDSVNFALWHSVSKDGGESFETAVKITDVNNPDHIEGISDDRLYPCPYLACDNSSSINSNNLYMTWTANGITEDDLTGANIYFSSSTDGGETWSDAIIVNKDPKDKVRDQFYSSITVNPNGVVVIAFYDASARDDNTYVNYYMNYSFDGGKSFIHDFVVSTQTTDFTTVGNATQGFGIGEYNQVVASSGYAIPVWSDGRKNNGDLDIYVAFVEISKDATSIDKLSNVSENISSLKVYPNPASDKVNISFKLSDKVKTKLTVVSEIGEVVKIIKTEKVKAGINNFSINVKELATGKYFIVLQNEFGVLTKSVVVQK
ncbi:MAG: T9SS type A sorting domain-containing protein [Bacteroidota bacterium]|nr:T9SS type A sorting domain-containing protein [Bacteroidota bacterium]